MRYRTDMILERNICFKYNIRLSTTKICHIRQKNLDTLLLLILVHGKRLLSTIFPIVDNDPYLRKHVLDEEADFLMTWNIHILNQRSHLVVITFRCS